MKDNGKIMKNQRSISRWYRNLLGKVKRSSPENNHLSLKYRKIF